MKPEIHLQISNFDLVTSCAMKAEAQGREAKAGMRIYHCRTSVRVINNIRHTPGTVPGTR